MPGGPMPGSGAVPPQDCPGEIVQWYPNSWPWMEPWAWLLRELQSFASILRNRSYLLGACFFFSHQSLMWVHLMGRPCIICKVISGFSWGIKSTWENSSEVGRVSKGCWLFQITTNMTNDTTDHQKWGFNVLKQLLLGFNVTGNHLL